MNFAEKTYNRTRPPPESITLCVDNDEAGRSFAEDLASRLSLKQVDGRTIPVAMDMPEDVKDWNDVLTNYKKTKFNITFIERRN